MYFPKVNQLDPAQADFTDGIYQGALDMERRPDGPGIMFSDSGYFYIGEWDTGIVHGKGFLVLPKGHFFYGSFKAGRVHGYGVLSYPSGVLLFGQWINSRIHGFANFYLMKNLSWIEAEFNQGKLMKYVREERVESPLCTLKIPHYQKEFPTNIKIHKSHRELILDFIDASILKNVEAFQIETQKSSFAKIKCHLLEPNCLYLGFILNGGSELTGLGTVIKDLQIPFYGQLTKATLNGLGKFFLSSESYYLGHFREGNFQGVGCLYESEKHWSSGRWNGSDLVLADDNSGIGHPNTWINRYLKELHRRSTKYVNRTICIEKLLSPAFEELLRYDSHLGSIEAFKPGKVWTQQPSQCTLLKKKSLETTPPNTNPSPPRVSMAIDPGQSIFKHTKTSNQPSPQVEVNETAQLKEPSTRKGSKAQKLVEEVEKPTPAFQPTRAEGLDALPQQPSELEQDVYGLLLMSSRARRKFLHQSKINSKMIKVLKFEPSLLEGNESFSLLENRKNDFFILKVNTNLYSRNENENQTLQCFKLKRDLIAFSINVISFASRSISVPVYLDRLGKHCMVLICHDSISEQFFAIKLTRNKSVQPGSNNRETTILSVLQGLSGVPQMQWFGAEHGFDCIVMELCGRDLSYYIKKIKSFDLQRTLQIGLCMIDILEGMHSKYHILKNIVRGVIHRNIKPENILHGRESKSSQLFLIDYGKAKLFRDQQGQHMQKKIRQIQSNFVEGKQLVGSTLFCSIAAHHRYELSRKDDLESLGYVLIYLFLGALPWQTEALGESEEKTVLNMKQALDLKALNVPIEFQRFIDYVRKLSFKAAPDYKYLSNLLQKTANSNQLAVNSPIDWNARSAHHINTTKSCDGLPVSQSLSKMGDLSLPGDVQSSFMQSFDANRKIQSRDRIGSMDMAFKTDPNGQFVDVLNPTTNKKAQNPRTSLPTGLLLPDENKSNRTCPNKFNRKKLSLSLEPVWKKPGPKKIKYLGEIRVKDRQNSLNVAEMIEHNDLSIKMIHLRNLSNEWKKKFKSILT